MGRTAPVHHHLRIGVLLLGAVVAPPLPALDWQYNPELDDPRLRTPEEVLDRESYPNGLPGSADPRFTKKQGVSVRLFQFNVRATRQDSFEEERTAVRLASETMDRDLARQTQTPLHSQVPGDLQGVFSDVPITLDFGIVITF